MGLIGCSKIDKNESSTNSINSEKRTENGWEVIINKDEMRQQEKNGWPLDQKTMQIYNFLMMVKITSN